MSDVERLEAVQAEPPARTRAGQGRKRLDVEGVREWLWAHPGEWCRVLGADSRGFTDKDVTTLRGALGGGLFREDTGNVATNIETRRRPDGLCDLYVKMEQTEGH